MDASFGSLTDNCQMLYAWKYSPLCSTFSAGSRFTKCVVIDEGSAGAAQLSLLYFIICEPIFYLEEGLNVSLLYGTNTPF